MTQAEMGRLLGDILRNKPFVLRDGKTVLNRPYDRLVAYAARLIAWWAPQRAHEAPDVVDLAISALLRKPDASLVTFEASAPVAYAMLRRAIYFVVTNRARTKKWWGDPLGNQRSGVADDDSDEVASLLDLVSDDHDPTEPVNAHPGAWRPEPGPKPEVPPFDGYHLSEAQQKWLDDAIRFELQDDPLALKCLELKLGGGTREELAQLGVPTQEVYNANRRIKDARDRVVCRRFFRMSPPELEEAVQSRLPDHPKAGKLVRLMLRGNEDLDEQAKILGLNRDELIRLRRLIRLILEDLRIEEDEK